MAQIGVEARFRVVSMAERDLARVVGAFSPAFGRLGVFMSRFTRVAGEGFKQLGGAGAVAAGLIFAGFMALRMVFRMLNNLLNKFLSFMKDVVKEGMSFQKSMILVGVATRSATDKFVDLATSLPLIAVGAKEASKGLEVLVRAGFEAKEALAVFPELAIFSKAVGASMSRTASILVGAVRAFSIEAEDSRRVLDTMAFAILRTRFNFETFSTAFAFGGAAAAGFGQELEETVGVMAKFFDLGLRASTVGTTIRNMLSRLAKPTTEARAALLQYGITLKGVNPTLNNWGTLLKRLIPLINETGAFTTIFGRRTGGFIKKLVQQIRSGEVNIESFTNTIKASTDIIRKVMLERLNTATGQLGVFAAQWQTFKVEVFNAIEPIVKVLFFEFNMAMMQLRDTFKNNIQVIRGWGRLVLMVTRSAITGVSVSVRSISVFIDRAVNRIIENVGDLWQATQDFANFLTGPLEFVKKAFRNVAKEIVETDAELNKLAKNKAVAEYLKRKKGELGSLTLLMASFLGFNKDSINVIRNSVSALGAVEPKLRGLTKLVEEQTGLMLTKFKNSMQELNDKFGVSKQARARLTRDMAKTIIELAKLIETKDIGGLIDKMAKLGAELGTELSVGLIRAARESIKKKELGEAVIAGMVESFRYQEEKFGRISFLTPAVIKKIFKSPKGLIQEEVFDLLSGIGEAKIIDKLVGSLIKADAPTDLKRQAATTIRNVLGDVIQMVSRMREDEPFIGITLEDETKLLEAFRTAAGTLMPRLKDLQGTFGSLNNAVDALGKTWKPLNKVIAQEFVDRITEMREAGKIAPKDIMKLTKSIIDMGKAATKSIKALDKLPPTLRAFFIEQLQLEKALSDPKAFEAARIATGALGKRFLTAMKELKGLNKEIWEQVNSSLPALAKELTRDEFGQYLTYLETLNDRFRIHKKKVEDQTKFLKKNTSLLRDELELTWKELVPGYLEDSTMAFLEMAHVAEKAMRKTIKISRNAEAQQKLLVDYFLAGLTKRGRESFKAFQGFVKGVSSSIARSLVDSTFKFKDAFKSAINEMKAKLLELLIIQPIIGGIMDFFVPGSSFLFFQHGTSMRGVPGSGGVDKVPAMLTAGEIVLDKSASDVIRALAMTGGAGRTVNLKVDIHALDGADVRRVMHRSIVPMINRQLRTNQGIAPDVKIRANKDTHQRGFR